MSVINLNFSKVKFPITPFQQYLCIIKANIPQWKHFQLSNNDLYIFFSLRPLMMSTVMRSNSEPLVSFRTKSQKIKTQKCRTSIFEKSSLYKKSLLKLSLKNHLRRFMKSIILCNSETHNDDINLFRVQCFF